MLRGAAFAGQLARAFFPAVFPRLIDPARGGRALEGNVDGNEVAFAGRPARRSFSHLQFTAGFFATGTEARNGR